jgi:hypothetical protein
MTDTGFKKGMRVRVVNPGPRRAHTKGWEGYLAQKETKGARVRPTGMWEVIFVSGRATFHQDALEKAE